MNNRNASTFKVSFGELTKLPAANDDSVLSLEPCIGEGSVQIFNIAKGLQARFWNYNFKQDIEVYGDARNTFDKSNFTLVFFLNTAGVSLSNKATSVKEAIVWDTIFISCKSNYKINIPPHTQGQCLSITFSKKWLCENVFTAHTNNLHQKVRKADAFPLLQSMSASEKKSFEELFHFSWKKSLGSFYIKSSILKVISDFFAQLKERNISHSENLCLDTSIDKAEDFLNKNVAGPLPNLKDLAKQFSISESTLKRHFKKKFGVNMSSYFLGKKIDYAKELINAGNVSIKETAVRLGYRSVNGFISMIDKYSQNSDVEIAGISFNR
jgi:AraC-like DNA-binding protein